MRMILFITALLGVCGCNSQDMATLGRIGHKVQDRVTQVLGNDPDAMMKAMPLVPPAGTGRKLSVPNSSDTDKQ